MEPLATVIVIHGFNAQPDRPRWRWLRGELEARRITVEIPQMPRADRPAESEWLDVIDGLVESASGPIILVGHSLGGLAVLRWLESRAVQRIHAAVLLAGVTEPGEHRQRHYATEWGTPKRWDKIRAHAKHLAGIYSDNDVHVPMAEGNLLEKNGGATLLRVHNRGHFMTDDGVTDLPELLQIIDNLTQLAQWP